MEFAIPDYVRAKDNRNLSHLPGTHGWPLFGEIFRLLKQPYQVQDEHYRRYGPVSRASFTTQRLVLCLGPEFIQQLMLDREESFSTRMGYEASLGDFFHGGLLMRDFAEHKFHRRIMQTAFKTEAMSGYVEQMHPIIDAQLESWAGYRDFLFYPNIKLLLLDIGARVFLGMDLEGPATRKLNQDFLHMNQGMLALVRKDWPGLLYRKGMNGRRNLERFFIGLVPERHGRKGSDMATMLANELTEDGEYFSPRVVGEHLVFLLLAAHDTTTSALTMGAHILAQEQQWQDRLREEVRGLHRSHLAYEDLGAAVPDLENSFREVLRLHPPVPMFMRRTIKEVDVGGYPLPAHTLVEVSPMYTHRMEKWWNEPHRYDPDRFARDEHKQHSFLWSPFGGGAHKCIGLHFADMLYKCVLSRMLLKYRFRYRRPEQVNGRILHFPFAKPRDNLPLLLEPLS